MFAAYATRPDHDDPLSALTLGERADPAVPPGWVPVTMRAASLNMHDVSTLRGIRMSPDRYPMILGCDGAGVLADGTEVVILPCVNDLSWCGPETLDPSRTVLSEFHPGTFATTVAVPARNAVPKPPSISFAEAACTGTAWLTAYRMVFVQSGLRPGQHAFVLGRRGSINTAVIRLAETAGIQVYTSDSPALPPFFDAVFDAGTDEAEWSHAVRLLRPGGTVVCAGYRSGETRTGYSLSALHQIIFGERRLVGCDMGTREDLVNLLDFLKVTGLRPEIGLDVPLTEADKAVRAMIEHTVSGKIVLTMS